jgi:hypothetical protein
MEFDTKVAIIILDDLAVWQKLNVTAFLATGIAGAAPDAMGEPYIDTAGRTHARLLGQPMMVYQADSAGLLRLPPRNRTRTNPRRLRPREVFNWPR